MGAAPGRPGPNGPDGPPGEPGRGATVMSASFLKGERSFVTTKPDGVSLPSRIAFCPFASRFPFETWIVPKTHSSHFENIQKHSVEELARVLRQTLAKIRRLSEPQVEQMELFG